MAKFSLSARLHVAHGTKAARSSPATARKEKLAIATPATAEIEERDDRFVVRNGVRCAGAHLIIDLYGAERLDDIDHIEAALRRAVNAASATLLHIHLHHFEPNGGVSGSRSSPRATSPSILGLRAATPRSTCSCAARPTRMRAYRCCGMPSRRRTSRSASFCAAPDRGRAADHEAPR